MKNQAELYKVYINSNGICLYIQTCGEVSQIKNNKSNTLLSKSVDLNCHMSDVVSDVMVYIGIL